MFTAFICFLSLTCRSRPVNHFPGGFVTTCRSHGFLHGGIRPLASD